MIKAKIVPWECVQTKRPAFKELGWKVVFTNGCFDLMHAGHAQYLQAAKALGDVLVVGLNSDESVSRIKGSSRPIIDQENRAFMLAALSSVDYVVIFEEDTPLELIKFIRPDVLVKGGDWAESEIVGADIVKQDGGQVYSLPLREGLSSSKIIEKILRQA
jgi:rfaE bifunctional protein nucleotidyltransferase chain/domain